MKLWDCHYTLDCPLWTDEYVDYWYSVKGPTALTICRYWDKIHAQVNTVTNFRVAEVKTETHGLIQRVLRRTYKERE